MNSAGNNTPVVGIRLRCCCWERFEVKFSKGRCTMMYKDFGDPYTEVDFLKAKVDVTGQFPPKRAEPCDIPKYKKSGILNLLRIAPAAKKLFWLDMVGYINHLTTF